MAEELVKEIDGIRDTIVVLVELAKEKGPYHSV